MADVGRCDVARAEVCLHRRSPATLALIVQSRSIIIDAIKIACCTLCIVLHVFDRTQDLLEMHREGVTM